MPSVLVDVSTSGDTTLVTVPAGSFVRIFGLNLTANGQVVVSLKVGTTTVWKTYAMDDAAAVGGIVLPFADRDLGVFDDAGAMLTGQNLIVNLSAAIGVAGSIDYAVMSAVRRMAGTTPRAKAKAAPKC